MEENIKGYLKTKYANEFPNEIKSKETPSDTWLNVRDSRLFIKEIPNEHSINHNDISIYNTPVIYFQLDTSYQVKQDNDAFKKFAHDEEGAYSEQDLRNSSTLVEFKDIYNKLKITPSEVITGVPSIDQHIEILDLSYENCYFRHRTYIDVIYLEGNLPLGNFLVKDEVIKRRPGDNELRATYATNSMFLFETSLIKGLEEYKIDEISPIWIKDEIVLCTYDEIEGELEISDKFTKLRRITGEDYLTYDHDITASGTLSKIFTRVVVNSSNSTILDKVYAPALPRITRVDHYNLSYKPRLKLVVVRKI